MNSAVFNLGELRTQHDACDESWLEFLKLPSLSMGVYRVAAGANDHEWSSNCPFDLWVYRRGYIFLHPQFHSI